jgi:hypothetical protein
MSDEKNDKPMDEMLDTLLASYSSAEPRPGLETRILASLRDAERQQPAGRAWNFGWLWAGAAAAVAIILVVALLGGHRNIKPPVVVQKSPAPVQPEPPRSTPPVTATAEPKHHGPKAAIAPATQNSGLALRERPAIFPTPTPLSEQEKLMLTYLANTPHEEIIAQTQRDEKEADAFWGDRDTSPEIPAPVNPTRR